MNRSLSTVLALLATWLLPAVAMAADDCTALLCLAGNWRAIPACVPPVEAVLRDLARGRAFPTCPGNSTSTTVPSEATCPPMYSLYNPDSGNWTGCSYEGITSVTVNGAAWFDVFWNVGGDTSTRYTLAARTQLGTFIDPKFDADQAAWDASHLHSPAPLPCSGDNC